MLKCTRSDKSKRWVTTEQKTCARIPKPKLTLEEKCQESPCPVKSPEWYASRWAVVSAQLLMASQNLDPFIKYLEGRKGEL